MSKVLGIDALAGIRDWVKSEDDTVKAELRTYIASPENLTAGNAEQLTTDKGITDKVPYLLRASGGNGAEREEDKIVGGTVAWNQLVQHGNFDSVGSWSGMGAWKSYTISDNTLHLVSNANQATYVNVMQTIGLTANHKYFISLDVKASKASGLGASVGAVSGGGSFGSISYAANTWARYTSIAGITTYTDDTLYIRPKTTTDTEEVDVYLRNVYLVDLTQMFGTSIANRAYDMEQSTAGSGIAWLKSMGFFTADYYPYDAGTLKSVEGLTAHSMVGFNQWDEEWEVGDINASTGNNAPVLAYIRAKNFIPVIPTASYYFKTPVQGYIYRYSKDGTYLGYLGPYTNTTFTMPSDVYFVRFVIGSTYGTTYNHDICINLSDPAKNGTYEPYVKHSYPLDSSWVGRGVLKLDSNYQIYYDGDEYYSSGKTNTRYGIVDLGTLVWVVESDAQNTFRSDIPTRKLGRICEGLCSVYGKQLTVTNFPQNMQFSFVNYRTEIDIFIKDIRFTDAATFKAAMSGVYLLYELATPTIEEADPYQNPQIVDPYGTEEYETTGIVPVGHETFYPENLRSKIEGLPFNFATLIAPTETTYKATRAYSTGNLFIVNNILYKATTSIASGGTVTPGTNCTATTLAEIIAALS